MSALTMCIPGRPATEIWHMDAYEQFLQNVLRVCVKLYKKKAVLSQGNRQMQL